MEVVNKIDAQLESLQKDLQDKANYLQALEAGIKKMRSDKAVTQATISEITGAIKGLNYSKSLSIPQPVVTEVMIPDGTA